MFPGVSKASTADVGWSYATVSKLLVVLKYSVEANTQGNRMQCIRYVIRRAVTYAASGGVALAIAH
jgi:hypothetical protein